MADKKTEIKISAFRSLPAKTMPVSMPAKTIPLSIVRGLPARTIFLPLISILLISGILFSPDAGIPQMGEGNFFNAPGYDRTISTITIALAGLLFAASLIYMASQIFKVAEWEAFAKNEIYQALISVLIAVVVFAGALSIDRIVNANIGGNGMFDVAQNYVGRVSCIASAATIKLEGMKMGAQYLAGMKGRYFASAYGWGMQFPMYPGFDVIERALDLLQSFISPFTASLFVQGIGLELIHAFALSVVLPAGILLRIFPPTRDAGAFLIASALGFYFVFPFFYAINARVMYQLYKDDFGYDMCNGSQAAGENFMYEAGPNRYDSLSLQMLPKIKEDFIGAGGLTKALSYVIFQSVFLPSMGMVLVVAFINAGTKFFSQKGEG